MLTNMIEILLVEDNPNDVKLALHAFKANKLANNIQVVRDGAEALDVVERCHVAPNRLGLVVLDLMLPRVSGLEVLQRLLSLGCRVPVVATSVSASSTPCATRTLTSGSS